MNSLILFQSNDVFSDSITKMKDKITIAIADDQQLFLRSLSALVNTFEGFEVVVNGLNGEELIKKIAALGIVPDMALLDVQMPVMDGMATAAALTEKYPLIKAVALSTRDDDGSIIGMLKAGCCAYLLKDIHPDELEKALNEVNEKGYYNADAVNINYRRLILHGQKAEESQLSDKERRFLELACSDMTYKQIAAQMGLAERTIDGYRESVFEKLKVQSRVGMAMEGIRRGWVKV